MRYILSTKSKCVPTSPPERPSAIRSTAFSRVGVKIWNGIPQILKERPKKAFKGSLKEMLLDFLETEDSYIDVDTIIVKMKK